MHFHEIPEITLGSGSFYLKDECLTDKLPLIEIHDEEFPQYIKSFHFANPADAEATFEAEIDIPMFHRFTGISDIDILGGQTFSTEFSEPYQEQRRKHKKKRINKKWAKRYGYVTKFRKWRIKEMTFTGKNNFEFEATGRNVELVTR